MQNIIEHHPTQAQPTHTVICLHGLGASGDNLLPLVQQLNLPSVRFVLPTAPILPITLYQGEAVPAWYNIHTLDFSDAIHHDYTNVEQSCISIRALIADEQARYGIGSECIFLMGFSQGGSIALELGLHYEKPLAGIIGLSTLPAKGEATFEQLAEQNRMLPIFLAHGRQDNIVPYWVGELIKDKLTALQYPVAFNSYDMMHEITPAVLSDLKHWLQGLLD